MPTWHDVVATGLKLPGVEVATSYSDVWAEELATMLAAMLMSRRATLTLMRDIRD